MNIDMPRRRRGYLFVDVYGCLFVYVCVKCVCVAVDCVFSIMFIALNRFNGQQNLMNKIYRGS